jgi:hypothetical protein
MAMPEFQPNRGSALPTAQTEAIQALVNLGYKSAEAKKVVRQVAKELPGDATAEHIVQSVMTGSERTRAAIAANDATDGGFQPEVTRPPAPASSTQPADVSQPSPPTEDSESGSMLDKVQTTLDGVGVVGDAVVPGAGVAADGTNAAISVGRAFTDPKNAQTHLFNAGVSVVSMVPFVGDIAKAFKYGGKASKAGKTARGAASGANAAAPSSPPASGGGSFFDAIWNKVEAEKAASGGGTNGASGSPPRSSGGGGGGSGDGGDGSGGLPNQPPTDPLSDKNVRPLTDKVTEAAGTFGKVIAASLAYAKTTELLNRGVLEYHRHISGFNGELSAAFGRLEAGRLQRQIQNAQDYGGSVAGLADEQNNLEEALRDFQSPFTEMGTDIQIVMTRVATGIVKLIDILDPVSELWPSIRDFFWFSLEEEDQRVAGKYFDQLKDKADKHRKNPKDKL